MLNDYRLAPASGQSPDSVVLLLHGLGDNGNGGFLEIGKLWQPYLPNTEFICPDAPFAFDMGMPGFEGRQWFSLREFTEAELIDGVAQAAPILNDYIDHILKTRNLPPRRLVLVGFSQGTMMSLQVAPRRAEPVAGVVGFSGMLVSPDRLQSEKVSTMPVLLVHGTHDMVVPFKSMAAAEGTLRAAGYPVETQTCSMLGHSIDQTGAEAGLRFLLKVLNQPLKD